MGFNLPEEIHTPDLLYHDELAEEHPDLIPPGLTLGELDPAGMADLIALADRYGGISRYDASALALARSLQCPLLTGDALLREAAVAESVEVHGTIWLMGRLMSATLLSADEARAAFTRMRADGRRLPWKEAESMIRQCSRD